MLPDLNTFAGSTTSRCQRVVLHHHEQAESAFCTDQLLATKRFAFDPQDRADQLVPLQQACYTAGVEEQQISCCCNGFPKQKDRTIAFAFVQIFGKKYLSAFPGGASFHPWMFQGTVHQPVASFGWPGNLARNGQTENFHNGVSHFVGFRHPETNNCWYVKFLAMDGYTWEQPIFIAGQVPKPIHPLEILRLSSRIQAGLLCKILPPIF